MADKELTTVDIGSVSMDKLENKLAQYKSLLDSQKLAAEELVNYQLELEVNALEDLTKLKKETAQKFLKEQSQAEIKKAQYIEQTKAKLLTKQLKKAAKKKGGKLTPEEIKEAEAAAEAEFNVKNGKKAKLEKLAAKAAKRTIDTSTGMADLKKNGLASMFNKNSDFNKLTGGQKLDGLAHALGDFAKQLESTIDSIAGKKGAIDTRLQGSKNKTRTGSYWEQLAMTATGVAGVSPFIKQESYVNNIQSMVEKGIAFNLDQRAFLATISEKIATTFDAADGTLLRLVRIQQQDTTAGRLGMESALTSFLNNMYETTEYMTSVASSVRSSLEEMSALSGATMATEIEYQMQKWMGSLYSVGMSQNSVNAISAAFGQLASGDISGLNGGAGNLLVMAANQAGISISDILNKGLDANSTNSLMQALVNYMGVLGNQSSNSRVVQQQLANVYGIKASDLKAAGNLASSTKNIAKSNMSYGNMLSQLNSMAGSMYQRTSIGEMMSNMWSNTQYSMANGIASNPALYAIYKAAGLLDSVAGGIAIPAISAMGTGVDLETTVADMMRVTALSGGILSSIGSMIAAGGGGGISGTGMLKALGIGSGLQTVSRGSGGLLHTGGATVSNSGYVGNSSGGDVLNATTTEASDNAKAQTANAIESEEADIKNKVINESVLQIAEMLQKVMDGSEAFNVKMDSSFS